MQPKWLKFISEASRFIRSHFHLIYPKCEIIFVRLHMCKESNVKIQAIVIPRNFPDFFHQGMNFSRFKWRGKLCPAFWPIWWADGSMESLDQTHGLLDLSLKNRHNTHILNSYTMLYTFTNIFIPPRVTGTALQAELPGSHDLRLLVFLLLYMLYSRNFQKVNLCKQAWFSSLRWTLDCVASCMADDLPCWHLPLWTCYVIERCANLAHQQSLTQHITVDF